MDYSELVEFYGKLESTTKRLIKTDILVELFRKSSREDLAKIVNLLQGKVFPDYDERKIGFSSRLMIKAINSATGISVNEIEKLWSGLGDLGKVTEALIKKKTQATLFTKNLTVDKVFNNIRKLADLEGEGTVNKKISLVTELLTSAKPNESRFIVGTILEELRVGIAEGVVRDAIAKSFNLDVKQVEEDYNLLGDYAEVAERAKENKAGKVSLKPGRPLKLMLPILVKNIEESFEALGKPVQLEFKIDGFRLEIHKDKDIKLFTRRLENVTKQFPDVVKYIKENVKGNSFIIDAEAVAYDKKTGKHLPFQNISQRIKRKYDIEGMAEKFPVESNVFDIIYYNGKSLMNEKLKDRRELLEKIIKEIKGKIVLTKKLVTDDIKKANEFYQESLKNGNEGLMIKNLNSTYKPGRYVNGWYKLKSTLENLDLVVVKAEYGEGKRARWLSSYTIACQDKEGKLLEVGKVSTGIKEKSEEDITYNEMTKLLKPLIIKQEGKEVVVKPKIVIEVGYEEIQKSPTYNSGYALRFPRVKRLRIKEKTIQDINTIEDIKRIYNI